MRRSRSPATDGDDPTTFISSDHGFAPQWYAVNVSKALQELGYGPEQGSNCRAVAAPLSQGLLRGWNSPALHRPRRARPRRSHARRPPPSQHAAGPGRRLRGGPQQPRQLLHEPRPTANPGKQVVLKVMKKEELRNVDGTDSLHPNRSGDVVVVFRPPYQTDASTPGQLIAFSQFFGQHGYLPEPRRTSQRNMNMHGTFIAAGAGHPQDRANRGRPRHRRRTDDRVPDGHPGHAEREGEDPLRNSTSREDHKGDHDPRHLRLPRTAGPADRGRGQSERRRARQPHVLDRRRGVPEAVVRLVQGRSDKDNFTVAAGDSVGATPPISAFFGDTPTIEMMNLMGFSADGLGNHNFDRGSAYLRNTLIPLAEFPYTSANVVASQRADAVPSGSRRSASTSRAGSSASSDSRTRTRRHSCSQVRSTRSKCGRGYRLSRPRWTT